MEIKDYNIDSNNLETVKNIKIGGQPSLEEKIDYIYKTMKHERRVKTFWGIVKLLVFLGILFTLFFYIPSLPQEKIEIYQEKASNFMKERVTKFITPIIKDMTQDMIKDMNLDGSNSGTGTSNNQALEQELQRKLEILKKIRAEN